MANIVEFIYKLTDQVSKPLERIAKNTQSVQGQAAKTQSVMDKMGTSVLKWGAAFFGAQQAITQGKAFIRLGLDIEQTRAKFESLTGSLQKGNWLIDQLSAQAAKSPFNRSQLMGGAELLLAYGMEAEKVTDIMRVLGDIAMGDKNKLSGLTLAFAQMSSTGKLTGQDLLQMINQGFNPLTEISRTTGKSVARLKDEMGKGKISAKMVEDAFRSATEEGGKFYKMSEKIAETSGGKFNTALGILQDKLTTMSEKLQPLYDAVANAFLYFANNFEKFAAAAWKALLPIRALGNGLKFFIQYRAALVGLIVVAAAYSLLVLKATANANGYTLAMMLQYKWLLLAERAQKLFNGALLKNPFTAVLVGITLVVGALITLRKRTKESADGLGEAKKTAASFYAQERADLDLLFGRLKKTNPASAERKRIIEEIAQAYPELNRQQLEDIKHARDLTSTYEALIEVIGRRAKAKAYESALQGQYESIAATDMLIADINPGASEQERVNQAKQLVSWLDEGGKNRQWIKDQGFTKKGLNEYIDGLAKAKSLQEAIYGMDFSNEAGGGVPGGSESGSDSTDVSSLTKSGRKATNINITFRNLIEYLNMHPQTVTEGVDSMSDELIEGLLRVVNSANRIATQ